jgi:hypothetical protein
VQARQERHEAEGDNAELTARCHPAHGLLVVTRVKPSLGQSSGGFFVR